MQTRCQNFVLHVFNATLTTQLQKISHMWFMNAVNIGIMYSKRSDGIDRIDVSTVPIFLYMSSSRNDSLAIS